MGKFAFLVAVNKYSGGDIGPAQNLRGCVNDIAGKGQTRDKLVHCYGFKDENIRMLIDERATKRAIWERLEEYVAELQPGDTFLWWQSCHGTRFPWRDPKTGMITKVINALCPADFTWNDPVLGGPMLKSLFMKARKGAKITCVFDACHTGDAFRDLRPLPETAGAGLSVSNPHYRKARYVRPPEDILHRFRALDRGVGQNPTPGETPPGLLYFSGCDFDETSADAYINGAYAGAFTANFWKTVEGSGKKALFQDLIAGTRKSLKAGGYTQNPGLEGDPEEAKGIFLDGQVDYVTVQATQPAKPVLSSKPNGGSFFDGYTSADLPDSWV